MTSFVYLLEHDISLKSQSLNGQNPPLFWTLKGAHEEQSSQLELNGNWGKIVF